MSGQKIKCLVIIVNRDKGEQVAELCRSYQLYFTYGILALGTAGSDLLDYLGIGETDKELLFCCFLPSWSMRLCIGSQRKHKSEKWGHGLMFTMPLSGISSLFNVKFYVEESMRRKRWNRRNVSMSLLLRS